jgi:hypothetical protein
VGVDPRTAARPFVDPFEPSEDDVAEAIREFKLPEHRGTIGPRLANLPPAVRNRMPELQANEIG